MSSKLPPSLLRQHALLFAQGSIKPKDYRAKRAQILYNIIAMHSPTESEKQEQAQANETDNSADQKTIEEMAPPQQETTQLGGLVANLRNRITSFTRKP